MNFPLHLASEAVHAAGGPSAGPWWVALIPGLPLAASVVCGLTLALKVKNKAPAFLTLLMLLGAFLLTFLGFRQWGAEGQGAAIVHVLDWVHVNWGFPPSEHLLKFDFSFYMDGLSWLWMLFVTGLASAICLYASEYMSHDVGKGYGRFFAAFALFVFSMACLVMGDNLALLYLGWEGVGLCSYMLIGYFYKKPAAVAAAKKAFIVNRIGDLGLALGIFLIYVTYGTIEYAPLFEMVSKGVDGSGQAMAGTWQSWAIPCLLMVGAFGKSAQFPLYVWLPDAMEGPTPVSALIHAATMVTAGVYLIARMYPLFLADQHHVALNVVAWTGGITALLAATIGMAQFDIKRIMAYSTVSQLGYMFAGLGVLTSTGAAFHVFTHAFFKATLFLSCGAVMHGFAGQLDLRKLSGLWSQPGWRIVTVAMFVGCLNLAGVPFTAGYFSKDMILAEAFTTPGYQALGWLLLATAGLTAYYTFRVFFRVFVGPAHYEPGDELHGHDDDHGHDDAHGHAAAHTSGGDKHSHADAHRHGHGHSGFHPHPPGWAINTVLAVLAVASIVAAGAYFVNKEHHGWVGSMLHASTAAYDAGHYAGHDAGGAAGEAVAHGGFLGYDAHKVMYYVSGVVGAVGILVAFVLHYLGRREAATSKADALLPALGPVARWAQHKWYVDEFYDFVIRTPLKVLAHVFAALDKLLVDGLVDAAGAVPRMLARGLRPSQNGVLQSYATGMAGGLAVILIVVWLMTSLK
ncbi:MAG: NADH-quinone oxidoreductase subunit L [Planctomycetes bacterium]|nr:NADH-quinone oxidoreductase subunit L [Planctomycetota bacterium]